MSRRLLQTADLSALSGCAADLAQAFVSLASDIALVIDDHGVVTSVAQDPTQPMSPAAEQWVGKLWIDTVTGDTRRKIELLLSDVGTTGVGRRREVNLDGGAGGDIPVAYTALRLGTLGPVLAVGRDLRTVAAIQQRFLDTQQELERGYWKARQSDSRYRLLFQVATDAVMTVEGHSLRIIEANHAATLLLDERGGAVPGRAVLQQFDPVTRHAVADLLSRACGSGKAGEVHARLSGTLAAVGVSATPFRAADGVRLLLRVRAMEAPAHETQALNAALGRLVDDTRDGVVVTDSTGGVLVANPAFVQLVQAGTEQQLLGRPLAGWIGRMASDMSTLIDGVRAHGIAQLVASTLRRADGVALDADISGTLLTEGDQECFGFTVRPRLALPAAPIDASAAELARALAGLELGVGREPMAELLRRAEQLVRLHLARQALRLSGGDADAAATLLGIGVPDMQALRQEAAGGASRPPG